MVQVIAANSIPITGTDTTISLSNGTNSNVPIYVDTQQGSMRIRISGPTGTFSISGFAFPSGFPAFLNGGVVGDGCIVRIYNPTGQQMTILNNNTSSSTTNRISTLTGANVTLRAGSSFATFSYDGTDGRWILENTN